LATKRRIRIKGELRISKGRVFQNLGAANAKLREPKRTWTRGTDSKLESDERKVRENVIFMSVASWQWGAGDNCPHH